MSSTDRPATTCWAKECSWSSTTAWGMQPSGKGSATCIWRVCGDRCRVVLFQSSLPIRSDSAADGYRRADHRPQILWRLPVSSPAAVGLAGVSGRDAGGRGHAERHVGRSRINSYPTEGDTYKGTVIQTFAVHNRHQKLRYSWAVELDAGSTGEASGAANGESLGTTTPETDS